MEQLTIDYEENVHMLDTLLGVDRSFDMVSRDLYIAGRRCRIWVVDGYGNDAVLERIMSFWLGLQEISDAQTMQDFADRYITFCEVNVETKIDTITTAVFLGKTLFLMEGYNACALIDAKEFPMRGVAEPDSGKVLRGPHDGFVESVVINAALLRRRIRDTKLTMEGFQVTERSRADIVLCYLEDRVDKNLLEQIRKKLQNVDIRSLSMGQESLVESLVKPQWYNPFPRVRYTERPDAATACIMEGNILLMVDNSPAVIILPTRFFDFLQEANDFYFSPIVGSYLRILRGIVFLLTLFIMPVWYLLVKDPVRLPDGFDFLAVTGEYQVPLLAQLLLVEFIVDLLKIASLNTPSVFSSSFSMIGALVLGDFAVQAHWLVPEVLAYMAFVAIANFAQPSYELGYAFKLFRLLFLLLAGAWDWIGLGIGCLLFIVVLFSTKPLAGNDYMYPLYPFDAKALRALLLRCPISRRNT